MHKGVQDLGSQSMRKYKTIIADPPWSFSNTFLSTDKNYGTAIKEYPTMKLSKIKEMPIENISEKDCVLLLWSTWPQLENSLTVQAEWGFKYITGFPYIKITDISKTLFGEYELKTKFGIGFWSRGCSEILLICKKGQPKLPTFDFTGLLSPNLHHSRKPVDLYHYAETLEGPYLELFARRKREGWDSFGNEIENSIEL